jgi:hypothetical protein
MLCIDDVNGVTAMRVVTETVRSLRPSDEALAAVPG